MKINVKKLLVGLTPADMDNPVVKRLLAYVRDNGQGKELDVLKWVEEKYGKIDLPDPLWKE